MSPVFSPLSEPLFSFAFSQRAMLAHPTDVLLDRYHNIPLQLIRASLLLDAFGFLEGLIRL